MPNWMKVGTDVVSGGAAGAVDQFLQNQDEKRRRTDEAAGVPFSMWKHYGTWYNYGLPVLSVLGVAFNFIKPGNMETRLLTISGQLAGRKLTYQFTKAAQSTPWRPAPPGGGPVPQTQKPGWERVGIV